MWLLKKLFLKRTKKDELKTAFILLLGCWGLLTSASFSSSFGGERHQRESEWERDVRWRIFEVIYSEEEEELNCQRVEHWPDSHSRMSAVNRLAVFPLALALSLFILSLSFSLFLSFSLPFILALFHSISHSHSLSYISPFHSLSLSFSLSLILSLTSLPFILSFLPFC